MPVTSSASYLYVRKATPLWTAVHQDMSARATILDEKEREHEPSNEPRTQSVGATRAH